MTQFLPWWLTAACLASLTLGYWLIIRRPLGVSGSWARIILWKQDKIINQAEEPFRGNQNLLMDALMEATIEEFGKDTVQNAISNAGVIHIAPVQPTAINDELPQRIPWTAHLTFLVMLIVGGFIAVFFTGTYQIQFTLGELHQSLFGQGFSNWLILFIGGTLVGIGTQLGGGCTTGHGLSGVSRLVPASLIATMSFFGSAVIVSLLLKFTSGAM